MVSYGQSASSPQYSGHVSAVCNQNRPRIHEEPQASEHQADNYNL